MPDQHSVVMVAGECVPFAKVGGLADVIGALPLELEKLGLSVTVIIPRYKVIDVQKHGFESYSVPDHYGVPLGFEHVPFDVHRGRLPNSSVEVYLIGSDRFFDRDGIYVDSVTGEDYPDQADRWIFFQRSAIELLKLAFPQIGIVHCHDYQTGLIPAYIARLRSSERAFHKARSVFTIHNLGYQGLFPREVMPRMGFSDADFYSGGPFEFFGMVNFMKIGVSHADLITTVSERYAREIQTPEFGYGLEGVLQERSNDLTGILNGVDDRIWNPEIDPLIPVVYSPHDLSGKVENKRALLRKFGFDESKLDWPLIAMLSRIDVQKGFDLVIGILDSLLQNEVLFVLIGTGNKEIEASLQAIVARHPDRAGMRFEFDNGSAHLAEAGADMFLMPSKYEPCGLNQMYSMRYGTVPIVRATGGLADTVTEFNSISGEGTGFCFAEYDSAALEAAVKRALTLWPDRVAWEKLMLNGMRQDFSWKKSAQKYFNAYQRLASA